MTYPTHQRQLLLPASPTAVMEQEGVFITSIDHEARTVNVSLNEMTEHDSEDHCIYDDCEGNGVDEPHEGPDHEPFGLFSSLTQVEEQLTLNFSEQFAAVEREYDIEAAVEHNYRVRVTQVWGRDYARTAEGRRKAALAELRIELASQRLAPSAEPRQRTLLQRILGR